MKKILVPSDLSEISENALKLACQIADKCGAEIFLVNFIEHPFDESFSTSGDVSRKYDDEETIFTIEMIRRNNRMLTELANKYAEGRQISYQVFNEDLEDGVDNYIRKYNIDLVVMGTTGEENAAEFFTGNHTEKVIEEASCPVITLKEGHTAPNLNTIAFGVDLDSDDKDNFRNATQYLRDFASCLNASIHMVHINKPGKGDETRDSAALEDFAKKFELTNYTVEVVESKDVELALLNFAESIQAGVLAVLTHSEGGFFRIFSRSISEELSRESDIPVMTINLHRV